MHEVLVNHFGGLSLPRKSVVRLTDRPDMTLDVYRGRKTTIQQQSSLCSFNRDLRDNEIETVEDKVFDKLGSLSYLYLSNNQLTYFHTLPAGNFILISLSGNSIETIGYNAFTSLTDLQYL